MIKMYQEDNSNSLNQRLIICLQQQAAKLGQIFNIKIQKGQQEFVSIQSKSNFNLQEDTYQKSPLTITDYSHFDQKTSRHKNIACVTCPQIFQNNKIAIQYSKVNIGKFDEKIKDLQEKQGKNGNQAIAIKFERYNVLIMEIKSQVNKSLKVCFQCGEYSIREYETETCEHEICNYCLYKQVQRGEISDTCIKCKKESKNYSERLFDLIPVDLF